MLLNHRQRTFGSGRPFASLARDACAAHPRAVRRAPCIVDAVAVRGKHRRASRWRLTRWSIVRPIGRPRSSSWKRSPPRRSTCVLTSRWRRRRRSSTRASLRVLCDETAMRCTKRIDRVRPGDGLSFRRVRPRRGLFRTVREAASGSLPRQPLPRPPTSRRSRGRLYLQNRVQADRRRGLRRPSPILVRRKRPSSPSRPDSDVDMSMCVLRSSVTGSHPVSEEHGRARDARPLACRRRGRCGG